MTNIVYNKNGIPFDIDAIATDLNGKADTDLSNASPTSAFGTALNTVGIRTVVETYSNGTSWYRVYSDGWCKQGGYITSNSNETKTITFMKAFNNTNYGVSLTQKWNSADYNANASVQTTSIASMTIIGQASGIYWQTCGYIR